MKKQRFFLKAAGISLAKVAGISLALVMAFAMFAGCEQDTKIVYRTPENTDTGSNPPSTQQPADKDGYLIARSAEDVEAFLRGEPLYNYSADLKGLYVTAPVTIGGSGDNFHLPAGKTIIVTEVDNVQLLNTGLLGTLFASTSVPPSLTIANGSTLKLDGKLVLGSETDNTQEGKLVIEANATVLVGSGEGALISTTAKADRIVQKATASLIFENPGNKPVVIEGTYAENLTTFGASEGAAIIVVPTNAITNISSSAVDVKDTDAAPGTVTATAKTAGTIADITWPSGITTVIYTGTTALPDTLTTIDNGKTLIISNTTSTATTGTELAPVTLTVGGTLLVSGTLTVAANSTLNVTGTITVAGTLTNNGLIKTSNGTAIPDLLEKVSGKIEATGDVTVAADETLTIPNGTTLTIASSGKLTVAAVGGGTLPGKVTIANGGTLVSAEDSEGLLNGDLVVEAGGVYKDLNSGGATLWLNGDDSDEPTLVGNGKITWNAGAKGYVGEEDDTDLRIGGPTDAATLKLAAGGVFTNTKDGYELTGNATVGRFGLDNGLVFTIKENSIFTVDVPASVESERGIVITDEGCKIVGTDATSQIRILTGNGIYFWYDSARNFYNTDNTQIKSPIPAGTYTWNATAGGAGVAGWKAGAPPSETDTTPITADATKVQELLGKSGVTQVTYTGATPLSGTTAADTFVVPKGKTLIIEGNITGQAVAITVEAADVNSAAGVITNNGTITTANSITATVLEKLVGLGGSGTVVLKAAVTGVEDALALGTDLEIDNGGKITYASGAEAFSATETKTVTILDTHQGAALDLPASVKNYATANVTVVNSGTGTAPITTAITDAGELTTLLASNSSGTNGKVTAAAITVGSGTPTLTVPAQTALTITANVTGGTLTLALTGTIAGTIENTSPGIINLGTTSSIGSLAITNTSGTIQTADTTGAMLATLLGGVDKGTIEVTDGFELTGDLTLQGTAKLKVKAGEELEVAGSLEVEDGANIVAAGNSDSGTITGTVTQDVSETYKLSEASGVNPEAFTQNGNYTAIKDLSTEGAGLITITLKGEAGVVIANEDVRADFFDDASTWLLAEKAANGYSAVVIDGLVNPGLSGNIKQSNQGFNMYERTHLYNAVGYGNNGVYRQRDYKAKSDNGNNNDYYPDAIGGFDIILWNGAIRKTIDLEITQNSVTNNFLIDYTGVTFRDATAAWDTTTDTTTGITIESAKRDENGVDTIYLQGTNVAETRAKLDSWFGDTNLRDDAQTGNFAIVTIKDFFKPASIVDEDVEYNIISPAWAYYKDGASCVTDDKNGYTTAKTGAPWVYVDRSNLNESFVWRKIEVTDEDLTLLLWDGPTGGSIKKQAKIIVTPDDSVENAIPYTVIVDWTQLTIGTTTE